MTFCVTLSIPHARPWRPVRWRHIYFSYTAVAYQYEINLHPINEINELTMSPSIFYSNIEIQLNACSNSIVTISTNRNCSPCAKLLPFRVKGQACRWGWVGPLTCGLRSAGKVTVMFSWHATFLHRIWPPQHRVIVSRGDACFSCMHADP